MNPRLVSLVLLTLVLTACGQSATAHPANCNDVESVAWSPDGKQVAWSDTRSICIETIGDPKPRVIDLHPDRPTAIAWPRRHTLLFVSRSSALFTLDPAGDAVSRLGEAGSVAGWFGLRIAAHSRLLRMGCGDDRPMTITSLVTGRRTPVDGGSLRGCDPSLSPDARQIVFDRESKGHLMGIWSARTDGSHVERLSPGGTNPLWSPKRAEIVYLDVAKVGRDAWETELRLMPSSGGASVRLALGVTMANSWSPNGKFIAFSNENNGLSAVNVATKAVRVLTRGPDVSGFAWSHDSHELLVGELRNYLCSSVWRIPLSGGKPVRVWAEPATRVDPKHERDCE